MTQISSRSLKALLLGAMLSLSALALALPSPKDIEADVKAGQLDRAEAQLRQVLAEKPASAKAHYELGQVLAREGRYIEAEQELRRAQALEPSLKFASSPQQFDGLLAKVSQRNAAPLPAASGATPAARPLSQATAAAPATRTEPSLPWGIIALAIGGIALLVVWMRRAASANALVRPTATNLPANQQGWGRGYGQAYAPTPAYPANPGYGGYPPATAAGSGMRSAVTGPVVGGLAGVAAGYALSKALEGERHFPPENRQAADFTPMDAPRATPDLGEFDAGSGEGWGPEGGDSDGW